MRVIPAAKPGRLAQTQHSAYMNVIPRSRDIAAAPSWSPGCLAELQSQHNRRRGRLSPRVTYCNNKRLPRLRAVMKEKMNTTIVLKAGRLPASRAPVSTVIRKPPKDWKPEPCPLSREELRRIVAHQMG